MARVDNYYSSPSDSFAAQVAALQKKAQETTCETSKTCVSRCIAYGRVCPCSARAAGRATTRAIQKIEYNSCIFHHVHETKENNEGISDFPSEVPAFNVDDIEVGERLGEGGFCHVNSCRIKNTTPNMGDSKTAATPNDKRVDNDKEYAIKCLKKQVMMKKRYYEHGASDLAVEAKFLSALDHPNIVKLHGVTKGSVEKNVSTGKERGFFIVIDKLYDTLEQKIIKWREEEEQLSKQNGGIHFFTRLSHEYKEKRKLALMERLRIAYDIANVLEYLHSRDIIFRDLKPDNIGFDKQGNLKLFDFGLAKELKEGDKLANGRYQLTGNTGSRRYMAPEVATNLPYSNAVDIFSFGVLLWEMCTTEKPYEGYSSAKHMQSVVMGGERPKMDHNHVGHWPINLQWLVKKCWSQDMTARPSFTVIKRTLHDILNALKAEEKTTFGRQKSLGHLEVVSRHSKSFWKTNKRHRTTADSSRCLRRSMRRLSLQSNTEKFTISLGS